MNKTPATLFFALLLAAASGVAHGQTGGAQPAAASGAVSLEDRQAMMQQYGDYNLHLGFARPDGAFLADVLVRIKNQRGDIVYEGRTSGPFLFVQVPPGSYRVTAEYAGKSVTQAARVGRSAPMQYFYLNE